MKVLLDSKRLVDAKKRCLKRVFGEEGLSAKNLEKI
jgi:hypothetical protein